MKGLKDTFTLHNGVQIPCVGFGTFQIPDGDTVKQAVLDALDCGYVHIDTAAGYDNEIGVGQAIAQSGLSRDNVFVTSKLPVEERTYDKALASFDRTLEKLSMDYIDLYLIHWPFNSYQCDDWRTANYEVWRAFEKIYKEGRAKAIGLSNFLPHHVEALLSRCEIKPMVNQIEFHPGWAKIESAAYCMRNGIVVEGWSPLARGAALTDPTMLAIAEKYGKSIAQICVRWVLQHDVLPLPKTTKKERMQENCDVFDFVLTTEDMEAIDKLPFCGGFGIDSDTKVW